MQLRFRASLVLAWVLAAVTLAPSAAYGAINVPYTASASAPIAPGVRYERGALTAHNAHQNINIVEVDLAQEGLDLRLAPADGKATQLRSVVEMAAEYDADERNVVATINGSTFFYLMYPELLDPPLGGGTGQGMNVSDGELINLGAPVSAANVLAFGIDEAGQPMIGTFAPSIVLTTPAGPTTVNRINQRRLPNEVVVYSPRFDTTTWTDALGDEYVVEGFDLPFTPGGNWSGTVVAAYDGVGNTPIGPGQVVISVADDAAATFPPLAVGDEVSLAIDVPAPWSGVRNSVGGRNPLVADGQRIAAAKNGVAPRAVVGIDGDGKLLLVTADDGDLERGMNLFEMADLMISLGAVYAVNLDGGNSTQMAVRLPGDSDVTKVSSLQAPPEQFRPVANALQVISDAPVTDSDVVPPTIDSPRIALASADKAAKKRVSLDVSWSATDDSGVAAYEVEWQLGTGSWLTANTGGPSAAATTLSVAYGKTFRVRVRATDVFGNQSAWLEGPPMRVALYDDSNSLVTRAGGWKRVSDGRSLGGAYRRSTTSGATARLSFTGYQVAVVGLFGPRNGPAQIRVDGALVATAPTYAPTTGVRRVLYLGPLAEGGRAESVIEVRNAGTSQRPRVQLDALLVLEPALQ